ncbi:MAG TPA: VCBS repeat-containing protein, partial [Gemmatimonadales bacterium]|nr:VCBS repeat-containing protein [Gemmatimonadales bacterium]
MGAWQQRPLRTLRRLAMLAVASWACRPGSSLPGEWHQAAAYRWRDLPALAGRHAGFTQLPPSATAIQFANSVSQALMRQNRHLVQGSGVAIGDMDADGWPDIYLARIDGPNALYRNLGNWRFEEVAVERGVAAADRFSTGAAFADVDGDRDLDLLVTALGGPNALFLNDGSGHFTELTAEAGLSSDRGSTTMALADVDGDGDLDLYVANYKVVTALDLFPPQERAFDQVVQRVGAGFRVAPRFESHYQVQVRHDLGMVVRTQRADPDWFYLNDGSGRFQRVPLTAGRFLTEDGTALKEEPERFSLVASFRDLDGDGDPDLYVCNDFEDPDELWINDGTGTFRAAPGVTLRNTSNSSMAVDFSDVDRDGDVDFFVADMLSRDPVRRKTQSPTHTPLPKLTGRIFDRPQMQRNTLALNRGDGTFEDISSFAGVEASDWSWATLFLDVDLDGYEDILVATGHTWDVMDADTEERLQTSRTRVSWRDERFLFPGLPLGNVAFRNQGDLTFREVGRAWGFANEEDISHGIAAGDLDNDGDLDVVINRLGSPAGVFRNDATAPRVAVRLIGRSPNTRGVGAKIRLRGGAVPVQEKEVTVGGLYLSGSDPTYAFAVGDRDEMSLEV